MNPFIRFMRKLSVLLGRRRFLKELDEEMAFHRAQAAQEFLAGGMTPEAARQAAMRQFGNVTRLREQSHEAVTFSMETVAQDLRFATRQMLRSPGFAITAILTLTLGITANVIVFGVLQAIGASAALLTGHNIAASKKPHRRHLATCGTFLNLSWSAEIGQLC